MYDFASFVLSEISLILQVLILNFKNLFTQSSWNLKRTSKPSARFTLEKYSSVKLLSSVFAISSKIFGYLEFFFEKTSSNMELVLFVP
jgi:hypothetical protein